MAYQKHIGVYKSESDFVNDMNITAPWVSCIETSSAEGTDNEFIVKYSSTPITGIESTTNLIDTVEKIKKEKVYLTETEYEYLITHKDELCPATSPDGIVSVVKYDSTKLYFTYEK